MKFSYNLLLGVFLILSSSFITVEATHLLSSESSLKVTGTSTLHEWVIELEEMNCKADIVVDAGTLSMSQLSFEAVSESFKSEHGRMMNNKVYNALKSDDFEKVTFTLTTPFTTSISNDQFNGVIKGNLFIAGVKKEIQVPVSGNIIGNTVLLKGEKAIVMSEYGMEPPTALMGTITTGDEVTVHYNLNLKTIH